MTSRFSEVLALTDQVQAAMDEGDWQRAQALETERRAALEQLVEQNALDDELRAALTELYERNQRMIGEAHHHRRRMLREASTITTGQAALVAYGESRST